MKILYAAHNNLNSKIQLSRFVEAIKNKPYQLKIAAFKKSSPSHLSIDWTLDCLLNIFKPKLLLLDNENFSIYLEQVKYFKPDLIISDMEYFTSCIAGILNIPLIQCSSTLINEALVDKYNLGIFKKYSFILNRNNWIETGKQLNVIYNSDFNFVYSHLGDIENPPKLKNNFEWIRPYHSIGKESAPCKHNIVAGISNFNKNIIKLLSNYKDSVVFSDCHQEIYDNPIMKSLNNQEEYFCNIKNSELFLCEGQSSFLADAFYNKKYSIVWTNFNDAESIINSSLSEINGLSSNIYEDSINLNNFKDIKINYKYNKNIQFLHEKIEKL